MSVVGARPQFVKLAPVAHALSEAGHEHIIVHTGQHYDPNLSDVFFRDLGIPEPDVHLEVGSGAHGVQTGAMLGRMDGVIEEYAPDCVLVYGDTNSTLAAALSAVKLHVPLVHLEAGLRSFNRRMPEEHNRVLTDHAADLCLAPTERAMELLAQEGLSQRSTLVGDVMTDVLYRVREAVLAGAHDESDPLLELHRAQPYLVATLHRAETTDDPRKLNDVIAALSESPTTVILLAHPRLRARAKEYGIALSGGAVIVSDPLPYPQLVRAVMGSVGVVTDSGGLQKEAFLLRVPCTTLRTETEWTETVALGWNVLAMTRSDILAGIQRERPRATTAEPYGDGKAAQRVVAAIVANIG